MKNWLIKFISKEDYLNSLTKEDRLSVINEAVERLCNTVNKDDIFSKNDEGHHTFAGIKQTEEQVKSLQSEANHFMSSKLFRVLDKEVKYQVNLRLRKVASIEQHETALLLEFTWDTLKTKLKNI